MTQPNDEINNRINCSNHVLDTFTNAAILKKKNGFYVAWGACGKTYLKRWQRMRGQDFYPVWSSSFPYGGTATTALSQLIRWCQDKPVLPIATWKYWASDKIKLLSKYTVNTLETYGYPSKANCILCKRELSSFDWWSLNGISGPCCTIREGCKQNDKTK